MKSFLFLLVLGILFASTNLSSAQNKTLSALKLSPQTTKAMQKVKVKAFTVNKEGILKANRGYHIVYKPGNNRIWIKPISFKPGKISTLDETVDIGNGIQFSCNGCNGCKVNESTDNNGNKSYTCRKAECPCYDFLTVPVPGSNYQLGNGGFSSDWRALN